MNRTLSATNLISLENIYQAKVRLEEVVLHTPLQQNLNLSDQYDCSLFLKREDLQVVRSYKIRGAYNKMASLSREELDKGIVCASAGNHAQGVALACAQLKVPGKIFMPHVTPQQKVKKVKFFGKDFVEILLTGDTFDDAYHQALKETEKNGYIFIHPFNDPKIIEGQGTVGLEIIQDAKTPIDYIIAPVGGGGLISGVGSYLRQVSPKTKIIGVEPEGAPAMYRSLKEGALVNLEHIDRFVDGAAVRKVGDLTHKICQEVVDDMVLVPEGKVCSTILKLYNEEGLVIEPAGALTIAALDDLQDVIRGKNVVCIISGSNNDITRTEEIKERALLYEGLKHYFIIQFPQRAGALRDFLNDVLGEKDDITHFEYTKKHNREAGPALVGIQVPEKKDYLALLERMKEHQINFQTLNDNPMLFDMLV